MLIMFSGLPGAGKTTIAKALAAKHAATYIRVDEIEHALKQHWGDGREIGATGYVVAFAMASSNLKLGNMVVADSVNPVPESRQGWRDAARGVRLLEVEVICSDGEEHRRRVEARLPDIDGFKVPTWASVASHHYVPWDSSRLILDTAILSESDAIIEIEQRF